MHAHDCQPAGLQKSLQAQLTRYAGEVAGLVKEFLTPPNYVVDTYGFGSLDVLASYAKAVRLANATANVTVGSFLAEPLWTNPHSAPFHPLATKRDANAVVSDGAGSVPVMCQPKTLFFYEGQLRHQRCPSCTLADNIRTHAEQFAPPYFVHLWGGINPGMVNIPRDSPLELFNLIGKAAELLGDDFEVVGAGEMARLSRQALELEREREREQAARH